MDGGTLLPDPLHITHADCDTKLTGKDKGGRCGHSGLGGKKKQQIRGSPWRGSMWHEGVCRGGRKVKNEGLRCGHSAVGAQYKG